MRMLKGGVPPVGTLLSSGGGMRKLSSSPHLLGICEVIYLLINLILIKIYLGN